LRSDVEREDVDNFHCWNRWWRSWKP